jgi:hypothetical protein
VDGIKSATRTDFFRKSSHKENFRPDSFISKFSLSFKIKLRINLTHILMGERIKRGSTFQLTNEAMRRLGCRYMSTGL